MSSMLYERVKHAAATYCRQGDAALKKNDLEGALAFYDRALEAAEASQDIEGLEQASLKKGQLQLFQAKAAYEKAKQAASMDEQQSGYARALDFVIEGLALLPEDDQLKGWFDLLNLKLSDDAEFNLPDFSTVLGDQPNFAAVLGDKPLPSFSHIENLVFQGGGVKGIAYLGTLQALCYGTDFSLANLQRVGGTSAGAIQALAVALGYPLEEIQDIMDKLDFEQILDGDFRESFFNLTRLIPKVVTQYQETKTSKSFFSALTGSSKTSSQAGRIGSELSKASHLLNENEYGLFAGEWFRAEFLEPLIQAQCGGILHLTFQELHDLREDDPESFGHLKDLYVVGVNLTQARSEVFSYETTPHVIISDAVRISMSIPFVFAPHKIHQKIGGRDAPRTAHPLEHLYVDGGVMDNYPIWLFDREKYCKPDANDPMLPKYNDRTLGMKLVDESKKDYYERNIQNLTAKNPEGLFPFALQLLNCLYKKESSDHDRSEDQRRTIYVDNKGVKTTEFDLDDLKKFGLIQSGQQALVDFVKRYASSKETQQAPVLSDYLLNVYDGEGQTPLHRAARALDVKAVESLLALGISPTVVNQAGQTVLDDFLDVEDEIAVKVPFVLALMDLGISHTLQASMLLQMLTMAMELGAISQEEVDRAEMLLEESEQVMANVTCLT